MKILQQIQKIISRNYIIIIIILILVILFKQQQKIENYDTEIEQDKHKYDYILENQIDESKKQIKQNEDNIILDVNRPYHMDKIDERGWYGDVINCKNTGDLKIYCKDKDKWIFPY